jgi:hypothetical protein
VHCDVQHELGNEAPGSGEVHSESGDDGDSSVDAAERTECHLDRSAKCGRRSVDARSATNRGRSYKGAQMRVFTPEYSRPACRSVRDAQGQ